MIVGAMNKCPFGFFRDESRQCKCSLAKINSYRSGIRGPILDRFDIQISVRPASMEEILSTVHTELTEIYQKHDKKCSQNAAKMQSKCK